MEIIRNQFRGKLARKAFVTRFAIGLVIWTATLIGIVSLVTNFDPEFQHPLTTIVLVLTYLVIIVYNVSLYVRRMRDAGITLWALLAIPVPLISFILFCFLLFLPSKSAKKD